MSTPPQSTNLNMLPDDILKHILSLLPTKDAFRTKFVSNSWVPLCESLNVLSLDARDMTTYKPERTHFFQFMKAVLLSPRHPLKAVTLFLHYNVQKPCFKLNRFVEAAKRRGVEDLDIYWYCGVSSPSIFCSKTLVVLKLWGISVLSMVGFSIDLPSLKTLVLCDIRFYDLDDLMKVLYGCPKLEDLTTNGVRGKSGFMSTRYFEPLSNLIKATTWLFEDRDTIRHVEFLTLSKEMMKRNVMKTTKDDRKYPDHVPECVRSHVINYQAAEADFLFAIYILKNARLLQDMTIHIHSSSNTMQRSQFVENLSSFPRTSPACFVSFIYSLYKSITSKFYGAFDNFAKISTTQTLFPRHYLDFINHLFGISIPFLEINPIPRIPNKPKSCIPNQPIPLMIMKSLFSSCQQKSLEG
ncbi:putative F-box domain, FBD domain, leucine-rich repeat domain, L domain-containing protein [Medicago truncatula]|uniref:Putative F-box domain, FBD domain, leucine-rich repeat domain, L domain-containing protein n=1 Tax=Medicago truncatula TaxID=3880 RepID=A0A396HW60_MEDTR|nr:putative F-box domain, FBD domain, leucine-rich repeat domain, L domain-containing protein [Medicago truncatula]